MSGHSETYAVETVAVVAGRARGDWVSDETLCNPVSEWPRGLCAWSHLVHVLRSRFQGGRVADAPIFEVTAVYDAARSIHRAINSVGASAFRPVERCQ